ncbi:FKBP-type peptidyl-prolyl cis-trans isomerase [Candidatus Lokiarchaeum ossiferum]|uniref:Peptidyl-prolyl cis-trans isomerase n=1 Tax=Candidatus Lokiarchaeum ossiferum TaxID=2951803 RepID=A0ABY6HV58_9ARCH|nr:FKBP-type peptidyl-prolyl cis-trans isomerase [Candidatus Lokiarchaeum sp. B-35]
MKIQTGDFIQLSFTSCLEDGTIIDSSEETNQYLEFTVGSHETLEVFENAVLDREIGEEFSIKLNPQDAFGEYSDQKIVKLSRDHVPPDFRPEIGKQIVLEHKMGDEEEEVVGIIKAFTTSNIIIDLNPPLAGKIVIISLKVVNINRE